MSGADPPEERIPPIMSPHAAFILGEPEYESHKTMPVIARNLEERHGFRTTLCVSSIIPDTPDFPESEFSNLGALEEADVAVFYTRFRVLPPEQMETIRAYVDAGKPVVGLRTATHSFHFSEGSPYHSWNDGFGQNVLGAPWRAHHGGDSSTDVEVIPEAADHPILQGVEKRFHARSWLYHVLPIPDACFPLLWGKPVNPGAHFPPTENPVAWTNAHKRGRVFYTSLGHPQDFNLASFRNLVVNGIRWAAGEIG
jgi:type 1 glutamine amidotransferase